MFFFQHVQSFDEGKNLSTIKRFFPYHLHLYSIILRNSDQEASPIDHARQWFFIIPFTFKSSIPILLWFLTTFVESFCKKSFRWLAILSCILATLRFAFRLLALHFIFLLARLCSILSLSIFSFKNFGFAILSPFESTANSFIQRSIPSISFTGALIVTSIQSSTRIEIKYLFVVVFDIVQVFTFPIKPLSFRYETFPIFGTWIVSSNTLIPCV